MKSVASNLVNLKPNLEWASLPLSDRTGWKRVRFGDVVENCAETCDPAEAGLERFIAMEHLEPGSLHIRSWGNVADGTTFTRRCRPGQVLFGKRRAYQRKVAVAEFEAVVSGDICVLTPKNKLLLPDLLPFLCLSEPFFQHAVGTSAGSLSPRTNWSSLASFEFDLPPLDQQRRIAEILWKVDEVIRACTLLEVDFENWFLSYRDAVVTGQATSKQLETEIGLIPVGWKPCRVNDCVKFIGGAQPPRDTFEYQPGPDTIRLIQIRDYKSDEFLVFIRKHLARRFCTADDVMIGRYGPPIFQILRGLEGSYNVALIKAEPKEGLSKRYLYHYLKQRPLFELIDHLSQRSAGQTGIDMEALKSYPLPLPPIDEQERFAEEFDTAEVAKKHIAQHQASLRNIINTIIQ